MTTEERFERIERAIEAIVATQSRHDAEIEKNNQMIDKHNAAIRDLIAVSRSLVDSQIKTQNSHDREMGEIREALAALIKTVDRIIGHRDNGKN
jgi:hypothetical protein